MSVYMYLKINALGDYKKKYDPFARLLALKRGVGVCSVVGVVSGFYGIYSVNTIPLTVLVILNMYNADEL